MSVASQSETNPWRWRDLLLRYPVAAFAATGLIAGGFCLPFQPETARYLFAAVAILGGLPLAQTTIRSLLRGQFFVDLIATLAILFAILEGEFLAGAIIVLMQSGGQALEDFGLRRANRSLDSLLKRAPSVAHRLGANGEFGDVPAKDLTLGDTILIRPGDIIAADGVVLEGHGSVDEAALTGEPIPLPKLPGDRVFSGTINLNGVFQVRLTSTAAESQYERIVRMVQQAQGERAPINRLANRFTPPFTLMTLGAAALVWILTRDSHRALAVLVVATPCPLLIATPLAVLSAINKAASLNIIVKSGAAIEQAGRVAAVVFDKTGTLTSGMPALSEVQILEGAPWTPRDLLGLVAEIELLSTHVLANAVVRAARTQGLPITPASEVHEAPGTGIRGRSAGHEIVLGAGSYLAAQGVAVTEAVREERARLSAGGKTVACVGVDGAMVGFLVFEDQVRPEAARTLERLRRLGIAQVAMLTGDAPETAHAIATQVGMQEVHARLQPEDKLRLVRECSEQACVMMVGDGINDAPALASAGVGVAMGGYGAGIATDAADVVITVENVERVADVILLGRRMVRVAKQGILFGIGASAVLMIFAGLGYLTPAVGALCQEALDLLTILNALRVRGELSSDALS